MSRIRYAAALALGALLIAGSAAAQDAQLQEAQGVLQRMGFFKGRADGHADQRTADAISRFQQQANLPATGRLDSATLNALRQKNDTQFSRTLGAPSAPAFGAANAPAAEAPKPRAAGPLSSVQANSLAPPPGGPVPPTYLPGPTGASAAGVRSELSPPGRAGQTLTAGAATAAGAAGLAAGAMNGSAPNPLAAPRLGGPVQAQALAGSVGAPPPGDLAGEDEPRGPTRLIPYGLAATAVALFGYVAWLWVGPRLRVRRGNPLIAGDAAILDDGRRREPKF